MTAGTLKLALQLARLKYVPDAPDDFWQTPKETAILGGGDCEDMAAHFISLAAPMLPDARFRMVCGNLPKQGHSWVEVVTPTETWWVDPTNGQIDAPTAFQERVPIWGYEWTGSGFGQKFQYATE
jgi:hypothetical protein